METSEKNDNKKGKVEIDWQEILLIVFLGIFIFIYFLVKRKEDSEREKLKSLQDRLELLISSKTSLKKDLDNDFKQYYRLARIILFLIGLMFFLLFIISFNITEPREMMLYISGSGFLIFVFSYLFFANASFIDFLELYLKKKIYKKYINIHEQIQNHKEELKEVKKKMK